MIICDHIGKAYGKRYALQDFSYTFAPGHIYAILGPNGSGKSTFLNIITGNLAQKAFATGTGDSCLGRSYRDSSHQVEPAGIPFGGTQAP